MKKITAILGVLLGRSVFYNVKLQVDGSMEIKAKRLHLASAELYVKNGMITVNGTPIVEFENFEAEIIR